LAISDSTALAHDRCIFPKKAYNHQGKPRWEGSEAKQLLKRDIDEGKHKKFKPVDLYKSQNKYKKYPLKVFQKHVHQEVRRHKYLAQRHARTEKKSA
jgi:hypothetical protein